jgi:hypothetical protein
MRQLHKAISANGGRDFIRVKVGFPLTVPEADITKAKWLPF